MTHFCRFELLTTDADAARAFYAQVLGHERAVVSTLPEQARARGARPHWLGHLGVQDVEPAAASFVTRGATRLGPPRPMNDGGQAVVLRDPGGAVLALSAPPPADTHPSVDVVWHVLNTADLIRATLNYCELFGWLLTERVELDGIGAFQHFAFHADGPSVGGMADIAGRSGVHPHWLFFFAVDALEPALAATRAAGGHALDPITLPSGERICVCDDPQGAAFALLAR